MTYTQEQIDAQYQKLPTAVKHVIFAVTTAEKIFDTGQKYGLHIDQVGILADEVTYVMLGLTPASQFPQELQRGLGIGENIAAALGRDLNEAIFLPIREEMQSIGKPDRGELAPPTAPASLPSAEQVLKEIENPQPSGGTGNREQGLGISKENSGIERAEATEPDLLEKKLAKTFVLPRVESATREDIIVGPEVDPYREMPQ